VTRCFLSRRSRSSESDGSDMDFAPPPPGDDDAAGDEEDAAMDISVEPGGGEGISREEPKPMFKSSVLLQVNASEPQPSTSSGRRSSVPPLPPPSSSRLQAFATTSSFEGPNTGAVPKVRHTTAAGAASSKQSETRQRQLDSLRKMEDREDGTSQI
jgi:hypothetical protein